MRGQQRVRLAIGLVVVLIAALAVGWWYASREARAADEAIESVRPEMEGADTVFDELAGPVEAVGALRRELAAVADIEIELQRIGSMRGTGEWTALTSTDAGRKLAEQLETLRSVVAGLRRRAEACAAVETNAAALRGTWEIASRKPTPESVSSLASGLTRLADDLRALDQGGADLRMNLLRVTNAILNSTMSLHGHSSRAILAACSTLATRVGKLQLSERPMRGTIDGRMDRVASQLRN